MRAVLHSVAVLAILVAGCERAPATASARAPVTPKTEVSRGTLPPPVTSEPVATASPPGPWAEGERFRVHLEQNGKTIATTDHHATLARERFEIVMLLRVDETRDAFSISLHASTDPAEIANAARLGAGTPLADADFGDGSGVAEDWFDKEHALFAREGHHEIMWFSPEEHRCAKATRISKDTLSCTRSVQKLIEAGGDELSMREVTELLLVFAKLDHRGAHVVEKQRDWMVLRFE